ncbi:DUF1307 domain-containing protein [Nosocomiicoccus massiliensis]|uniref:DUF1307 domain-containing protein n=1 Tax=Nosocomiicoccus massiliensis TaxID=1232430 RepID=UPI0003F68024|nr:DUF1307 domain-containing protein [Nosocomiicoccus massiliensis]
MKLRTILLSLMVIVLVACNKGPSEHVFTGTIDDMDVQSTVVVEGDDIQSEHLVYELSYEAGGIEDDDQAKEAADVQREAYEKLASNAPDGAVKVNVEVDEEKQAIIMTFDLDYTTPENVQGLIEVGFLDGDKSASTVSFKETKEQYEADGLKEQE